ncbi:MAG: YqeG family HAD IIIA-type phosphatase [Bacilli bacterium]|jgi:hypothetical protein|nr:YqeG family HAD IIIA-type phosphatase [Bacilli bacterium]
MLVKFIPDIYQKSIYTIDYKKLKSRGIKCILFDVDNTLASLNLKKPTKKVKDLIEKLKEMGFKVILLSNASKKRLKPFKEYLELDCACLAMKPFSKKYKKILKEYKLQINEVASIGDQLVTDVLGGNRVGITTILVNPIGIRDHFFTKLNRYFEKKIIKKAANKKMFQKGKYYD